MMKARKNTTDRATTERDILNTAMPAFEEITGFCIKILEVKPAGKIQPDAVLQINAPDVEPNPTFALFSS